MTGLVNPVFFAFRRRRRASRRSIRRLRCSSRCLILGFTRNPPCSRLEEVLLHLFNPGKQRMISSFSINPRELRIWVRLFKD
jgi:hypothetical protein